MLNLRVLRKYFGMSGSANGDSNVLTIVSCAASGCYQFA